jgi:hypothetical protein
MMARLSAWSWLMSSCVLRGRGPGRLGEGHRGGAESSDAGESDHDLVHGICLGVYQWDVAQWVQRAIGTIAQEGRR